MAIFTWMSPDISNLLYPTHQIPRVPLLPHTPALPLGFPSFCLSRVLSDFGRVDGAKPCGTGLSDCAGLKQGSVLDSVVSFMKNENFHGFRVEVVL